MAYMVVGGWGCYEVGDNESTKLWFRAKQEAATQFASTSTDYRKKAAAEAKLVDESEYLIWTSDEYFRVATFCFPEIRLDHDGAPLESDVRRVWKDADGIDASPFIIDFIGADWGECDIDDLGGPECRDFCGYVGSFLVAS